MTTFSGRRLGLYLQCMGRDRLRLAGGGLDALSDWTGVDHFELSYDPGSVRSSTGISDAGAAFLYAVQCERFFLCVVLMRSNPSERAA